MPLCKYLYDNPYCSALLNLLIPLHISGVSHKRLACYYHPNVVLHASPFPKYQPSKITLTIKLKLEIRCTEASRKNKWRINKKERLRATPSDVLLFNIYSLTIFVLYSSESRFEACLERSESSKTAHP